MCETGAGLVERNCGNCEYCRKMYWREYCGALISTPYGKAFVLGLCTRVEPNEPNILVMIIHSCKEWASIEEVQELEKAEKMRRIECARLNPWQG